MSSLFYFSLLLFCSSIFIEGTGKTLGPRKKEGKTHPQYSNQPQTNGTDGKGEGTNGYGELEGEKTMTEILDWSN